MPPSPPLIICFGDSLTAGFQTATPQNPTGRETPYGDFLQERLGGWAMVRVSGICGELTGEMVLRFRQDVLAHNPAYVIILGGTNDLGWNAHPQEVMRNLVKLYEQALAASATPILVTVPSIRVEDTGDSPDARDWIAGHLARRHQLNGLIADYASRKGLPLIDLFAATADPATQQLAAVYSNDGLHLTTAGYRLLADLIYEQVFASASPSGTSRPALIS
ncbi:MAG: GDSL-type esterase/lipase family protein [Nitrospiraceae bacterium]